MERQPYETPAGATQREQIKEETGNVLDTATERGVTFVKGSDFYPREGGESSARLAFSFVSPAEIRTGVALLAEVLSAAPVAV